MRAYCRRAPPSQIGGADARKFLQGLITNDIGKAQGSRAIHAGSALAPGQDPVRFLPRGGRGRLPVDVAQDKAGELAKRLGFYRLRAEVEIDEEPSLDVAAAWGGTPRAPEGAIVYADPTAPRAWLPHFAAERERARPISAASRATKQDYHAFRIGLGVPEGGRDYAFGDAFPHEALFDQLNGVDFDKGCFVGQEVVSRMEHRGTARKRIVPVDGDGAAAPARHEHRGRRRCARDARLGERHRPALRSFGSIGPRKSWPGQDTDGGRN